MAAESSVPYASGGRGVDRRVVGLTWLNVVAFTMEPGFRVFKVASQLHAVQVFPGGIAQASKSFD